MFDGVVLVISEIFSSYFLKINLGLKPNLNVDVWSFFFWRWTVFGVGDDDGGLVITDDVDVVDSWWSDGVEIKKKKIDVDDFGGVFFIKKLF